MSVPRAPSPWLFALALPLGMAGLGLLLWKSHGGQSRAYVDSFYATSRLERLQGPAPLSVVALGSSLVGYGLAFDEDMEALARAQGRPLRFVRFVHHGRSLDTIPPLLARIRQHPPEILVMEAECLAWGNGTGTSLRVFLKHRRRTLFQVALTWAVRICEGPDAADAHQVTNRSLHLPGAPPPPSAPGFDPGRFAAALEGFQPQPPDQLAGVLATLQELARGGCRVVILPMGRSPEAEARFPAELSRYFNGFLGGLAARGFLVERQGCPLPQACYLDAAHLNPEGQARFSAWFLTRLGTWTGARP